MVHPNRTQSRSCNTTCITLKTIACFLICPFCCRPSKWYSWARAHADGRALCDTQPASCSLTLLKFLWTQLMAPEELVEIGAVALCKSGRLTDIATGDLQDLR